MISSPSLEEMWQSALENYGLERPSEDTEIHVFRVILQTSVDKKACTRSVTPAGPMSDPLQTLEQIIEEWWDLEIEEQDHSWMLTAVNRARLVASCLCSDPQGGSLSSPTPSWGYGSVMGASILDNCNCPPQVDQ